MKNAITATHCNTKRQKLSKLVEHRWVEKQTAVLVFKQFFSSIVVAFEYMIENGDSETSANSRAYLKSITDLDFIVCLFVVSCVFAVLKPYTEMLQSKNCELTQCYDNIRDVATHLAELKYDEKKFDELFNELDVFLHDNDITSTIPRTSKFKNITDYLRNTYEIFVESTLSELDTRFSKHQKNIVNIINLLPSTVADKTLIDVNDIFEFYQSDLPSNNIDVVKVEFDLWQHK